MSSEDLNQTDLQSRDFAVPISIHQTNIESSIYSDPHEDTSQIELHLETNVDVRSIDRGTPPKRETTIRDLVQTGTLGVCQLFVSHGFLEAGSFLPEETCRRKLGMYKTYAQQSVVTFPSGEISSLEQSMLKDALHAAQSSNDINTVIIQLPQFAIVALRCPPERIAINDISLEISRRHNVCSLLQKLILFPVSADTPATIISQTIQKD